LSIFEDIMIMRKVFFIGKSFILSDVVHILWNFKGYIKFSMNILVSTYHNLLQQIET